MARLSNRLRVLQIMHAPPSVPGGQNYSGITGVDRLVINMLPYWSEHDIEIVLIYPRKGPNWDILEDSASLMVDYGIGGKFDIASSWSIARIVRENNIQLIHTNGPPIDLFGAIASRLTGVPMVLTRHVMIDDYLISPVKKSIYKFVDSLGFRMCDRAVAICRAGERHLSKTHPELNGKIKLIYNGIQIDRFPLKRSWNVSEPDGVTIGFVGRLSEEKGCPDFLHVLKELIGRRYNVRGLVVGGGPDIDSIKSLAEEYGISDVVEFCGLQEDVVPFLHRMDIFLLPSYREGLPLVILEAMAVGLPVISTRIAGIPEQIIENENGFLVSPGDIAEMVDHCIHLVEHSDDRERFAKQSRKIVEERFTEKRMVQEYAACFWELAKSYSSTKH
jgi:glycosyltransferase involved in cell wall biosynthesis